MIFVNMFILTIIVLILVIGVYSEGYSGICLNKHPTAVDQSRCETYCRNRYGRCPQMNEPWAHGICRKTKCYCHFNGTLFGRYVSLSCNMSPWTTIWGLISSAQRGYKLAGKKPSGSLRPEGGTELGQVFDYPKLDGTVVLDEDYESNYGPNALVLSF